MLVPCDWFPRVRAVMALPGHRLSKNRRYSYHGEEGVIKDEKMKIVGESYAHMGTAWH